MENNVDIIDKRAAKLEELLEKSKDRRTVVLTLEDLRQYGECLTRLAMLERHIHNLNSNAYGTDKVIK